MKNKILTISIIFILLSFIFINNAFAFELFNANNTQIILPDLPNGEPVSYVYCCIDNWHSLSFSYVEGSYFKIHHNDGSYIVFECYNSNGEKISFTTYGSNGTQPSSWTSRKENTDNNIPVSSYNSGLYAGTLYNTDGTIFFPKTPLTVEIPAVETVEQIPTAITETLKMIIPVGLVVLSVVLLIYLTRRLIYRCS